MSIERNTHLLDWLNDGWTHCQHGTREWCEGYLHNAHDVIKAQDDELSRLRTRVAELEAAGYGKPVIRSVERAPLVYDEPVRRLELWQVPARELDNAELEQQMRYAIDRFEARSEHGGSPGEYWAERMEEIEAEQYRRRRVLSEREGQE